MYKSKIKPSSLVNKASHILAVNYSPFIPTIFRRFQIICFLNLRHSLPDPLSLGVPSHVIYFRRDDEDDVVCYQAYKDFVAGAIEGLVVISIYLCSGMVSGPFPYICLGMR